MWFQYEKWYQILIYDDEKVGGYEWAVHMLTYSIPIRLSNERNNKNKML